LDTYVDECRARLIAGLARTAEGDVLADYFERGKMIRARVVFASASAVGGDPTLARYAAEAIELLHGASLFHDDFIDDADKRRGLPALHRRVTPCEAILLGDFLLLRAFEVMCQAQTVMDSCHRLIEAIQTLGVQAQACCRGQWQEIEFSGQAVSESTYFAIVEDKTAAPFMAAAALGAIIGNGTERACEALSNYARHLGIAFQICDDMLDLLGEPEPLGKPVGNSFGLERPLLPIIYLLTHGSPRAQAEWKKHRGSPITQELQSLLYSEGIIERVRATQASHVAGALASLEGMPDSPGLRTLRNLTASALMLWG
jgi:geranylgeranyl diphosphate synthase type I